MIGFNNLTIDLFREICQYLTFSEVFFTLFGLLKHLDEAIRASPACIHLSKTIDRLNLQRLPFQCRSLILSGVDLHSWQTISSRLNLSSLQAVKFIKMNLLTFHSFLGKLPIEQLQSIHIGRFTWQYYPKDLYKQVWSILMNSIDGNRLHYLSLPYHIRYWNIEEFTNDFPALRQASLEYISIGQMLAFFNRTPNLRRFKACIDSPHQDLFRHRMILSKLTHLTLILQDEWSWREIEQLFSLFPHLNYLNLKLEAKKRMKNIFDPIAWRRLIEEQFPHLITLKLQLNCIITNLDDYPQENEFYWNKYWLERQENFHFTIKEIHRRA